MSQPPRPRRRGAASRPPRPRAPLGFTLVEVLVALAVMALLSTVAWQGLQTLVRSREQVEQGTQAASRLSATVAQWEADLQALTPSGVVPALRFEGATLRLTRAQPQGLQVVAWTLREGAWWRRAGTVATDAQTLQQQWQASATWASTDGTSGWALQTLKMLSEAGEVQLYYYRGNAWTHAQSTGDRTDGAQGQAESAEELTEALPQGVRLVLGLGEGRLTRDVALWTQ